MSTKENLRQSTKIKRTIGNMVNIDGTILNEDELISNIIIKIINYKEYSYKQNREFERLLDKELTWKNEEHNDKNWKKILTIYHEKMPQVMELY